MIKSKIKNNWYKPLIIGVLLIIIPPVINELLQVQKPRQIIGNEVDWLLFWGSYLGGIITLTGVYITIRHNLKQTNHILTVQKREKAFTESKSAILEAICAIKSSNLLSIIHETEILASQGFSLISETTAKTAAAKINLQFTDPIFYSTFLGYHNEFLDLVSIDNEIVSHSIALTEALKTERIHQGLINNCKQKLQDIKDRELERLANNKLSSLKKNVNNIIYQRTTLNEKRSLENDIDDNQAALKEIDTKGMTSRLCEIIQKRNESISNYNEKMDQLISEAEKHLKQLQCKI